MRLGKWIVTAALLAWATSSGVASAAACGGATMCACGDTVVADRTLTSADPVTAAATPAGCPSPALVVNPGITLNLGGQTIKGAVGAFNGIIAASNAVVTSGKISGFGNDGLTVFAGTSGQTFNNIQSRGNGSSGIACLDQCTIKNNISANNGVAGVFFFGSVGHTVLTNTLTNNGGTGLYFPGAGSGNFLQKNVSQLNVDNGIFLEGDGNTFNLNETYRNGGVGLSLAGNGNTLTSNKSESNKQQGILVNGNNNNLTLNVGKVNGAGSIFSGILVQGTGNHLKENSGSENTNFGVFAGNVGNFDDGKNFGAKNGNAVQCQIDGVVCR